MNDVMTPDEAGNDFLALFSDKIDKDHAAIYANRLNQADRHSFEVWCKEKNLL